MVFSCVPLALGLVASVAAFPYPSGAAGGANASISTRALSDMTFMGVTPKLKQTKATNINAAAGQCPPVHIIVVRASTESPGTGVIGSLAKMVMTTQQGSTMEAIDYPAALNPYEPSSTAGTKATTTALKAIVQKCPMTKVVMMGYSQGAHVIMDVMCGGGATDMASATSKSQLGPAVPPVPEDVQSNVVAMVQMGDPRKINGVAYNLGTSKKEGVFPRTKDQMCTPETAAKVAAYCDNGDSFCDSGANLVAHLSYTQKYNTPAAKFINDKIAAAPAAGAADEPPVSIEEFLAAGNAKGKASSAGAPAAAPGAAKTSGQPTALLASDSKGAAAALTAAVGPDGAKRPVGSLGNSNAASPAANKASSGGQPAAQLASDSKGAAAALTAAVGPDGAKRPVGTLGNSNAAAPAASSSDSSAAAAAAAALSMANAAGAAST